MARRSEEATISDVARLAEVSTATVSRALRRPGQVKPATRARILEAAQALSYGATRSASSLASGRTDRIAILNGGSLAHWFTSEILQGAYTVIRDHQMDLTLYRAGTAAEREQFFRTLPARKNADAMMVTSFKLREDETAHLSRLHMPLVFLNMSADPHPNVSIDDDQAARRVARHLVSLGHRVFAVVGSASQHQGAFWSSDTRRDSFEQEVKTLSPAAVVHHLSVPAVLAPNAAELATQSILDQTQPPTAVFVLLDELAIPLIHTLRRQGLRVPQDISVVGFDDHPMAASFGLTTVHQPVAEIGARGADLAVRLAAGEQDAPTHITIPTSLVLRQSTASPLDSIVLRNPDNEEAGVVRAPS